MLCGLGLLGVYEFIFKRGIRTIYNFILALILALIVFLPVNSQSGGIFFNPFDRARDFITYEPFGLNDWELKWRVYAENNNYFRLFQYGVMMSIVYFLAQFGVKVLGLIPFKKTIRYLGKEASITLYGGLFCVFLLGSFFNQAANPAESYNFFIAGGVFLTILTALNFSLCLNNKGRLFQILFILLIGAVTIPRWVYVQIKYLPYYQFPGSFAGVTNEEMDTYNFLRRGNEDDLVLILGEKNFDRQSPLVYVLTNKHMFLSGMRILEDHNTVDERRKSAVDRLKTTANPDVFKKTVREQKIDYVYIYKNDEINIDLKKIVDSKVFENKIAIIFDFRNKE
jgi:hypothetical protein